MKVVAVIPKNLKTNNHWYMYVAAFLDEQHATDGIHRRYPAGPYIGHCCELRFFRKKASSSNLAATRFDGCLFLPEYKLIISPCFSSEGMVDIHGFGGSGPYFDGVIHCVPSHTSCVAYGQTGVVATGCASVFRVLDKHPRAQQFRVPYETKVREVSICCGEIRTIWCFKRVVLLLIIRCVDSLRSRW